MLFKEDETARKDALAIRENVAYYRWTHDLVEVTGKDALKLLDKLFVNSIYKVPAGKTKYTTMLDENGRIQDDVIVMHVNEDVWWVSTLYGPQMVAWANAQKGAFDIAVSDISNIYHMYAVQGPHSREMMDGLVEVPIGDMKRFSMQKNTIGGIDVHLHRAGFTGEDGYEIYLKREDEGAIREALAKAGKAFGAREPETLEVYVRSIPMEKGMFLRQDIHNLSPLECGLDWSVDLSKDFIGKEGVEKVKKDGPAYQFVGVELDSSRESYEDIAQNEVLRWYGVPAGICRQMIYGYTVDKNIGFAIIRADIPLDAEGITIGPNDAPATLHKTSWC